MARHDVNKTKTQKMLAKASNVLPFNRAPIVIPRDKLELAHLKVKNAQNRNKYLIAVILILTGVLTWMILK
jgi:hypothetical protein